MQYFIYFISCTMIKISVWYIVTDNYDSVTLFMDWGTRGVILCLMKWHLGSLTAANWVSFDFNVSYSSCWGYSLINTSKLKNEITRPLVSCGQMTVQQDVLSSYSNGRRQLVQRCCFYYFVRKSPVALLEALCAQVAVPPTKNVTTGEPSRMPHALNSQKCHTKQIHCWNGNWTLLRAARQ